MRKQNQRSESAWGDNITLEANNSRARVEGRERHTHTSAPSLQWGYYRHERLPPSLRLSIISTRNRFDSGVQTCTRARQSEAHNNFGHHSVHNSVHLFSFVFVVLSRSVFFLILEFQSVQCHQTGSKFDVNKPTTTDFRVATPIGMAVIRNSSTV